jgi:16S rRNA (cytosine1402-N4)-methyltransferase
LEFNHKPVLLTECITGLNIKPDGIYVDGTMGGAGHSKKILEKLSNKGRLIGIDRDTFALETAKSRLQDYQNVTYVHGNHDEIRQILDNLNIQKVDGILLDLGVSSYQIDEKQRGFSYMQDSSLDMRMDQTQSLTAQDVVNTYPEEKLANIIYEYGEEKFSRQIAKKICEERAKKKITTTKELVEIIKKAIPFYDKNAGHPAKRTFQAIRIEVNDEIRPLKNTVKTAIECLNSGRKIMHYNFSLVGR